MGLGLLFAFGAALCFAGNDLLRKRASEGADSFLLLLIITALHWPPFLIWAGISPSPMPGPAYWLPALAALVIGLAASGLFLKSLSLSPLSRTVPLLSLTPVGALVGGALLLGERLTLMQTAGVMLTTIGVLLLYAPVKRPLDVIAMLRDMRGEPGVPLMLLVALLWSANGPVNKLALQHAEIPFHLAVQLGGSTLLVLLFCAATGRLKRRFLPGRPATAGSAGLVSAAALGLDLVALTLIPVALVETLKRVVGNLAAILLGRLLLAERLTLPMLVGGTVMSFGVALALLG